MILTVKKVMKGNYYLTATERAMRRVPYEVGAVLFFLIIITTINTFNYGINWLLNELNNPMNLIIGFFLGFFLLIAGCEYLSGIIYIKKFNNAYKNGIRYIGCPVISYKKKVLRYKFLSSSEYRALVRITDDIEVYTPVYEEFSDYDKYCDVYYYKKKYYFCLFREEKETYIKGGFTMINFKSKFIVQFIIDSLVLGIIFTILSRFAAAAFVSSLEGTAVCLPIVLCTVLANVLAAGIAVFLTQNTVAKKACSNIPNTITFYIVLAVILIALIVMYTILGFSTLEGYCANNIADLTISKDDIHSAVVKSVIISDIVQIFIFLILTPIWKKRHDHLFLE